MLTSLSDENLVSFDSKLDFIDSVFQQTVGQSFRFELLRLLTLDVMFRNTDRHLSNFGSILAPNGSIRFAPIFDNGLALGVSEGAYFDLDNLIRGFGYKIKPYELAVSTLNPQIDYCLAQTPSKRSLGGVSEVFFVYLIVP